MTDSESLVESAIGRSILAEMPEMNVPVQKVFSIREMSNVET